MSEHEPALHPPPHRASASIPKSIGAKCQNRDEHSAPVVKIPDHAGYEVDDFLKSFAASMRLCGSKISLTFNVDRVQTGGIVS